MKIKHFVFIVSLFLSIIYFLSCNSKNEAQDDTLERLGEFQELKVSESYSLNEFSDGELLSLKTNEDGIFLLLNRPNEIIHLSKNFEVVNRYSENGRGPGEFQKPFKMAVSGRHIFVADSEKRTIEIFDLDFEHLQTINIKGLPTSIDVYPDEYLIVSFVELGQTKLELYDSKLIKSIVIAAESNEALDAVGNAVFTSNGHVAFVRSYINQFFDIDPLGSSVNEFSINMLPTKAPATREMNRLMPEYALVADVFSSGGDIYLLAGISSKEHGQPIIKMSSNAIPENIYRTKTLINMIALLENTFIGYSPTERNIIAFNFR